MATYGPRGTSELVQLTGWDATALRNYALRDGTTYAEIVSLMTGAIGAFNAEMYSDPLWSSLVGYTDEPTVEYRVGSSNGFEEHTEFGRADSKRADTEGHMLPIKPYDRMLGWTWDYLRKARRSQIEADIADSIQDARNLFRKAMLQRLIKRIDDSGAALGLGSAGYSPGFATTAASTAVDFVPPAYGGNTFSNTHEHYVAAAGGWSTAILLDVQAELREHGHEAPFYLLASPSDESVLLGLSGFVPAPSTTVRYGTDKDLANIAQTSITPGVYPLGAYANTFVFVVPGMPQYYGFGYKTYGANSQRNPLRIRLEKGMTRPQIVAHPHPEMPNGLAPIQNLMLFTEFGVGVADRTNGTGRYVNNATWSDGTAT